LIKLLSAESGQKGELESAHKYTDNGQNNQLADVYPLLPIGMPNTIAMGFKPIAMKKPPAFCTPYHAVISPTHPTNLLSYAVLC